MTKDEAERLIAEIVAAAATVDPACFPVVQRGTPVDDALADLVEDMKAATQAMSEEIIEAGVKVVFPSDRPWDDWDSGGQSSNP